MLLTAYCLLIDDVSPEVSIRQWVLSFPFSVTVSKKKNNRASNKQME
jgi:hypothetical protein